MKIKNFKENQIHAFYLTNFQNSKHIFYTRVKFNNIQIFFGIGKRKKQSKVKICLIENGITNKNTLKNENTNALICIYIALLSGKIEPCSPLFFFFFLELNEKIYIIRIFKL